MICACDKARAAAVLHSLWLRKMLGVALMLPRTFKPWAGQKIIAAISCCLCAQRSGREISSIYTGLAELLRRWRMSRQMDLDFGWVRLMLLWQKVMSQLFKPTKALVVVEFLRC